MKRHPIHWPKMKLRGARRKYLAAKVVETVNRYTVVMAAGGPTPTGGGYTATFDVVPAGTPGARILEQRFWRDGFGRPRKRPVTAPPPKPKPNAFGIPNEPWHFTFKLPDPTAPTTADIMRAYGVAP